MRGLCHRRFPSSASQGQADRELCNQLPACWWGGGFTQVESVGAWVGRWAAQLPGRLSLDPCWGLGRGLGVPVSVERRKVETPGALHGAESPQSEPVESRAPAGGPLSLPSYVTWAGWQGGLPGREQRDADGGAHVLCSGLSCDPQAPSSGMSLIWPFSSCRRTTVWKF